VKNFIPYSHLDPFEQRQVHDWLTDHRVDYRRVPAAAEFDYDPATGEWRIPAYVRSANGRGIRVDPATGDPLMRIVRRRELRPLPWPRMAGGAL